MKGVITHILTGPAGSQKRLLLKKTFLLKCSDKMEGSGSSCFVSIYLLYMDGANVLFPNVLTGSSLWCSAGLPWLSSASPGSLSGPFWLDFSPRAGTAGREQVGSFVTPGAPFCSFSF